MQNSRILRVRALALITSLILAPLFLVANEAPVALTLEQVFPAALEGNVTIVKQALDQDFDPNQLDPNGRTALMYAAYNGHKEVVAKLLAAGADVNIQDASGSTALMFASSGPFLETVTLLLEKGAKVNTVDNIEHFSALMWAAAEGQMENVKLLLKHKADTTLQDVDGDTAETFAAKAGHAEVAEILKTAAPAKEEASKKADE